MEIRLKGLVTLSLEPNNLLLRIKLLIIKYFMLKILKKTKDKFF